MVLLALNGKKTQQFLSLQNPLLTGIPDEIWVISISSVFVEGSSTTWFTSIGEDVGEEVIWS